MRIVYGSFPQSLPDSLDNAPVHLPFGDHRVDDRPGVVHSQIALDLDFARLAVNFHDARVSAERVHEVVRVVERLGFQRRLHALRQVPRHRRLQRDVGKRHRFVRYAFYLEGPIAKVEIFFRHFQGVGGNLFRLFQHPVCGDGNGGPPDGRRPGAVRPPAHGDAVRVPVNHFDIFRLDAELVSHDLGKRRFLALAVGRSPREDGHFPCRVDADGRTFPQSPLEPDVPCHL